MIDDKDIVDDIFKRIKAILGPEFKGQIVLKLQNRSDKAIDDLLRMFGAKLHGWINYFGHFYKSVLYPTFYNLNRKLVKRATRKYKKLRRRPRRAHYLVGCCCKTAA